MSYRTPWEIKGQDLDELQKELEEKLNDLQPKNEPEFKLTWTPNEENRQDFQNWLQSQLELLKQPISLILIGSNYKLKMYIKDFIVHTDISYDKNFMTT